jgi:hypothetical protein
MASSVSVEMQISFDFIFSSSQSTFTILVESRSWPDEQNVLLQISVLSRNCKYKVNSFPANIQFGLSRILEVGQVNEGEQVGQVPRGELAKNRDYAHRGGFERYGLLASLEKSQC